MSNPPNLFTGDRTALVSFDFNQSITAHLAENHVVHYEAFGQAAKSSDAKGDKQSAAIFSFLSTLSGFSESFDTPQTPFVASFTFGDKRSANPSDLTADDVEALKVLAPQASDPALRARLHDVLWVLVKDVAAGQEAALSYVAAGKLQNNDENWMYAVSSFKRALQLAAMFGDTKPLFKKIRDDAEAAAKSAATAQNGHRALEMIRLLWERRCGDPTVYAPILADIATRAEAAGDLRRASMYREHEAEWHSANGNKVAAKAAKLAGAEASVKLAEIRATSQDKSALAASALLAEAIEMLRRAGAPKARIDIARRRLAELQQASLGEMKTISLPFDITASIEKAKEHVCSENFREALAKFVLGVPLSDPTKVRQEVIDIANANPLSHTMKKAHMDSKGRTTVVQDGLLGATKDEANAALEAEMFAHAARFMWNFRTQAFITPARQQIVNQHFPTFADLAFLVRNNPFVPPGHEGIFLRGLHAGFHDDFVVSSHLLTPQVENSIRYVLESHDVDVSIFKSDGTQPVKILGGLLSLPDTAKIFGKELVFELRGCLIEKTGFDFRNRVAHGFVTEPGCYSPAAIHIWWLVLRICIWPHLLFSEPVDAKEKPVN